MKKIIFKFWIINVLLSIVLFLIYRFTILQSDYSDALNGWQKFLSVVDVLFQFLLSGISFIAMIFCSLFIFLNLIVTIRNNYFFSFLTFFGISIIWLIYLLFINVGTDFKFCKTILILTIIYQFCTYIEFIQFRKKVNIYKL